MCVLPGLLVSTPCSSFSVMAAAILPALHTISRPSAYAALTRSTRQRHAFGAGREWLSPGRVAARATCWHFCFRRRLRTGEPIAHWPGGHPDCPCIANSNIQLCARTARPPPLSRVATCCGRATTTATRLLTASSAAPGMIGMPLPSVRASTTKTNRAGAALCGATSTLPIATGSSPPVLTFQTPTPSQRWLSTTHQSRSSSVSSHV